MKWKTRDGRELEVSEMSTTHIFNSLQLLRRSGYVGSSTVAFYNSCPLPLGEMAQVAFDAEYDAVMDSQIHPFIDLFEQELKTRGIDIYTGEADS